MGGGGVMRTAAKVAGVTVASGGFRGFPSITPSEHPVSVAARRVVRPASAIASSDEIQSNIGAGIDAPAKIPFWEFDDWDFAGAEEDLLLQSPEPMPRIVFGGAPTIEEAAEATSELKYALEKVYLSASSHSGSESSKTADQESALPPFGNSGSLESKSCVTPGNTAPPVPKPAIQAFRFLSETPAAQTVVASIASDPNVWSAVLKNEALLEFIQSHKTDAFSEVDASLKESVASADFTDQQSVNSFNEPPSEPVSEKGLLKFWQNVKATVVDMMSNLSDYFQNLFESALKGSADADGSAGAPFFERAMGASIMGLAVMVILMVVLKRA